VTNCLSCRPAGPAVVAHCSGLPQAYEASLSSAPGALQDDVITWNPSCLHAQVGSQCLGTCAAGGSASSTCTAYGWGSPVGGCTSELGDGGEQAAGSTACVLDYVIISTVFMSRDRCITTGLLKACRSCRWQSRQRSSDSNRCPRGNADGAPWHHHYCVAVYL
jgi:hypothetical protein